jgi:hypothetical protein
MHALQNVYEINLIDNELNPFESAVVELSKMPCLTSLHLNLHEELQVDFVISTLPSLKYLNGEEIDREELQAESSPSDHPIDNDETSQDKIESFDKINEVEEDQEGSIHHMTKEESKRQLDESSRHISSQHASSQHLSSINASQSEILDLDCTDSEEV